jgi:hypothetical protein
MKINKNILKNIKNKKKQKEIFSNKKKLTDDLILEFINLYRKN